MNDRSDIGVRLDRWFSEEAPPRAPERLVHATRERTGATRQAGGIRAAWLSLPRPARRLGLVVAVIAAAAIALSTAGVLPGSAPGFGSPPTPAAPTPSTSPCPSGQGECLGRLAPGSYTTHGFVPSVTYTVPAGWTNTLDTRAEMDLSFDAGGIYRYPDGNVFHDGISFFRRPVAEASDAQIPLFAIGKTAKDLADWLDTHVDLDASGLTPVTVGGAPGYRLTIAVPKGPRTSPDHCRTDHALQACESLFISDDPAATWGFGVVGPESAVVYLIDAPSGDTLMVVIDDVDGVDQAGLIAAGTPVVNSLVFGR
jgi:hypothetical protein